ncbi:hypothetical protein [Pseudomonas hunanensis]|uniref:hypothetical protein n=1 Tax=Pseudomonas hunanensis TaxID=1247546 RepID=UPI0030DC9F08
MTKSIAQDLRTAALTYETTPEKLGQALSIPDTLVKKILSDKLDELAVASEKIRELSRPPYKESSYGPVSLLFAPHGFCPAADSAHAE